ncbi:MAG: hypothetical protein IKP40_09955 [Clostridia bacterium]|nr:hypothetical protein [Clostridia bacterium]
MRTFTIDRQRYSCEIDPRTGTPFVTSIHPYDETEYHWARKSATGDWLVYRNGRMRVALPGSLKLTPEQVAARLLNMDQAAHLTRTGGIW